MRNLCSKFRIIFSFIFILVIATGKLFAQTNEDCLTCHEDNTLTKVSNGITTSVYVNKNIIGASVHSNVKCISCHTDAAVKDFPHADNLAKVVCGNCHSAYQKIVDNDVHHKLLSLSLDKAPTCKICHGTHQIVKPSTITDKATTICGKCHKVNKLSAPYHTVSLTNDNCVRCHKKKDYISLLSKSVHSKLTCSNCHGWVVNNLATHRKLPIGEASTDCYLCHSAIALEHKESIHGIALSEGVYEAAQCWDCHGTHDILHVANDSSKVFPKNQPKTCGKCHNNAALAEKYSFAVKDPGIMYSQSVHGKLVTAGNKKAPSCTSCHGIHDIKNRTQAESQISSIDVPTTCGKCHKEITEEYKQSIHWIAVKKGIREAPSCNDCHSEHGMAAINTAGKRAAIKKLQETTCLVCHQNRALSERYGMEGKNASSYLDSYHGLAVEKGDDKAALCIDCHGVHKILPKYHKESMVNPNNVTATCKKCHANATDGFAKSYSHVTPVNTPERRIEDIVGTVYFWLIIIVIGGMIIHNLIIMIFEWSERHRNVKKQIRMVRLTSNELIQHHVLFLSFIVLAITGFNIKYPDSWWGKGLQDLGLTETVRQLTHRVAAVIMITLSLYHVVYLIITARGRDVLKGMMLKLSDLKLAVENVMYYLRLRRQAPEFDNFSYIEKAEYWALIWGTVIMGVTGFVLWFPTVVGNWAPVWFIKVSEIVHFYEAILATLAIIVWHWFFVILHPKEYPISFTSVDGKMTLSHFKADHTLKYKQVIKEWAEMKSGNRARKDLSHFTHLFISTIEKSGANADDIMQTELDNDIELKAWLDEQQK